MYCLTVAITSDEWIKIRDAAAKQWPAESLSCGEIVRRYTMFGIESLKTLSPAISQEEHINFNPA